jgi:hypothetical protein
MKRLVLLLSVFLAWAILARKRSVHSAPRRLPFPTRDSHARIDLADANAVKAWCDELHTTEERLRAAISKAGTAQAAVRYELEIVF